MCIWYELFLFFFLEKYSFFIKLFFLIDFIIFKLIEYLLLDIFKFWWESFKLILVLVIKEIFETDIGLLLLKIGEYIFFFKLRILWLLFLLVFISFIFKLISLFDILFKLWLIFFFFFFFESEFDLLREK